MVIMMVKVLTRMAERERHSGRRNFSLGWIRDGTDLGFVMSTSHPELRFVATVTTGGRVKFVPAV